MKWVGRIRGMLAFEEEKSTMRGGLTRVFVESALLDLLVEWHGVQRIGLVGACRFCVS